MKGKAVKGHSNASNTRASPCIGTVPNIILPSDTLHIGAQTLGSHCLAENPGFKTNYPRGVG